MIDNRVSLTEYTKNKVYAFILISDSLLNTTYNIICLAHYIQQIYYMKKISDLSLLFSSIFVTFRGIQFRGNTLYINIPLVPQGPSKMWRSLLSGDSRVICSRAPGALLSGAGLSNQWAHSSSYLHNNCIKMLSQPHKWWLRTGQVQKRGSLVRHIPVLDI